MKFILLQSLVSIQYDYNRQAQTHVGDGCVKWQHFLFDVYNLSDGDSTGTQEMSLKPGFHLVATLMVSICRRLIGYTPQICCSRLLTVTIIWKPGLT